MIISLETDNTDDFHSQFNKLKSAMQISSALTFIHSDLTGIERLQFLLFQLTSSIQRQTYVKLSKVTSDAFQQ